MPPLSIVQTWKHRDLADAPRLFAICQPTWVRYHPDWVYVRVDDKDIDDYVRWCFPTLWKGMWQRYAKGIERADLFRYLYLFREGGLYADLDFECLRPFDPLVSSASADVLLGQLSRPDHPEGIPNALMIARRPRQLFWLLVLEEVRRAVDAERTVERTGPVAVGRALRSYRSGPPSPSDLAILADLDLEVASIVDGGVELMPQHHVYPICWMGQQWKRRLFLRLRPHLSHERVSRIFPRSYAVTYWAHSWDGP